MSSRPIEPRELVERANRLVGRQAGAGRPRTVDLRAGISRAVLHEITSSAAGMLMDGDVAESILQHAYKVARWICHADVRALSDAVLGRGNQAARSSFADSPTELMTASRGFGSLQDARHLADYEHDFDVDRYSALLRQRGGGRIEVLGPFEAAQRHPLCHRFLRMAGGSVKIARSR